MSERITQAQLDEWAAKVNRRLNGSGRAVIVEQRNDYSALNEYRFENNHFGACLCTITVGTEREIAEFLHGMIAGIDLSREPRKEA